MPLVVHKCVPLFDFRATDETYGGILSFDMQDMRTRSGSRSASSHPDLSCHHVRVLVLSFQLKISPSG